MAMKLFLLVLLAVTAIYAVSAAEQEYDDEPAPEKEDDDVSALEKENDDDDKAEARYNERDADDDDKEVEDIDWRKVMMLAALRKKQRMQRARLNKLRMLGARRNKQRKWGARWNRRRYCLCGKPKQNKSDEQMSEDEPLTQEDLEDGIAQRLAVHDEADAKNYKAKISKQMAKYFTSFNLRCYCTKDKLVIALMRAEATYKREVMAFKRRMKNGIVRKIVFYGYLLKKRETMRAKALAQLKLKKSKKSKKLGKKAKQA